MADEVCIWHMYKFASHAHCSASGFRISHAASDGYIIHVETEILDLCME